jgi:hypothetical protein
MIRVLTIWIVALSTLLRLMPVLLPLFRDCLILPRKSLQQFRSGKMKSGLGYARWFRDQTVISHTSGAYNAAVTVSGGGQTTSTGGGNITTSAMPAASNLKRGDIVTIDNVFGVNRTTKQSQGTLRQFVVTADVASGAVTIPIYPGLIPSATGLAGGPDQQYQTVDSSPDQRCYSSNGD